MIQQPVFNEVHNEDTLDIGTKIDLKELLQLPPEHRFLLNATDFSQEVLTQSILRSLVSVGGIEFLNNVFHRNIYLAMRMSTKREKIILAKAIEKFLDYDGTELRLIFFYLYFYIKTEGIDPNTLTVIKPDYVLSFQVWKSSLRVDEIEKIQSPGELWEGLDLIGVRIKSPDIEKSGRARNRAISLFVADNTNEQPEGSI